MYDFDAMLKLKGYKPQQRPDKVYWGEWSHWPRVENEEAENEACRQRGLDFVKDLAARLHRQHQTRQ